MTFTQKNIFPLLQEAVLQIAEQTCHMKGWASGQGNNAGMAIDIRHEMEQHEEELRFLHMNVTQDGLEIYATVGQAVNSWDAIRGAVYHILGLASEQFLVVTPFYDETTLQFWFVTGGMTTVAPHGHIGVIIIQRQDVKHLEPEGLEDMPDLNG